MNYLDEEQWVEWQAKRPTLDVVAFNDTLSFTIDKNDVFPKIEVKSLGRHYRTIESTISITIHEKDLKEELIRIGRFFLEQAESFKDKDDADDGQ